MGNGAGTLLTKAAYRNGCLSGSFIAVQLYLNHQNPEEDFQLDLPYHHSIRNGVSLKPYNTFQIDATADYWAEIHHEKDLPGLMETAVFQDNPHRVLGGGSNVLFADNYHGLIIKNSIPGITVLSEDRDEVILRVGAGVVWDDLVGHTLNKGWGGLENLSMIPGLTGAAPIQNIGAYGVELESVFLSLDALHLENGNIESFDRNMCRFGYRESIFKTSHQGTYLITHVTLMLSKCPKLNLDYGKLREVLASGGITNPDIRDVGMAVRKIRASKLPDPAITGNAGSFFKNPVISSGFYSKLQDKYPDIPGFPVDKTEAGHRPMQHSPDQHRPKQHPPDQKTVPDTPDPDTGQDTNRIKIPAAWLIDKCGFKGMRVGDAGVHEHHALILVNHGQATGKQVLEVAQTIRDTVGNAFGIRLDPEVNIVNGDID